MRNVLLGMLAACAGCHLFAPYENTTVDGAPAVDDAQLSSTADSPRADGPASGDAKGGDPADAAVDGVADGSGADVGVSNDGPLNDGGVDGLLQGACNPGLAVPMKLSSNVPGKLTFCESSDSTVKHDQCGAETLCNSQAGWSLCPASVYRQLVKVAPPPSTWAWIAGCVRDGAALGKPTEAICSCVNAPGSSEVTSWHCASPTTGSSSSAGHLGLVSYDRCRQAGLPLPETEGYWLPQSALGFITHRAVCCMP